MCGTATQDSCIVTIDSEDDNELLAKGGEGEDDSDSSIWSFLFPGPET